MKKLKLPLLLILSGLFLYGLNIATGSAVSKWQRVDPLVAEQEDLEIWLVTDIHYISPKLHDDGAAFADAKVSGEGKDLEHIDSIMQALVWEAANEQPDLLIASGDLTFNGEYQSMVEMADYFKQIEANGTQVSVLPGNHDINNSWAKSFASGEKSDTKQVSPEAFRELFADYGFDLAIYQDPQSLSYVIEPKPGYPILMMDTVVYRQTETSKDPVTEGALKVETADWLADYFQKKSAAIWVGHQPLLSHNDSKRTGDTIKNATEVNTLLNEQGIRALFAGHTHAQNISSDGFTREVVTGSLANFPNSIGEVTISSDGLTYEHRSLAVEDWAVATNQTDPDLLNYDQTAYDLLYDYGAKTAVTQMFEEEWHQADYEEPVMDFVGLMNIRYFSGLDFNPDETLAAHPGYRIIEANSDGYLKTYTTKSMEDTDLDDRSLFIPGEYLVK